MENSPEAPVTPEVKSEATPNTNPEPAKTQEAPAAPDMHGFTSEQLADMQKFFQANGGYDKVKSRISNPTPAPTEEQKPVEPAQPAAAPQEQEYKAPVGSITRDEYFTKRYFLDLASEEKHAGIAKEIASGEVLKEMASLGIRAVNQDGSINASVVNDFLDLKAKTVPAKQSSAMPEAAAAPTVDYVPVGENIKSMEEARAVIMQDMQLKRSGQAGHPSVQKAEEYLRNALSNGKK
jgi:hypothetical protein